MSKHDDQIRRAMGNRLRRSLKDRLAEDREINRQRKPYKAPAIMWHLEAWEAHYFGDVYSENSDHVRGDAMRWAAQQAGFQR